MSVGGRTTILGKYELRETLGSGIQGKVKLALDLRKNEFVALKILRSKMTEKAIRNFTCELIAMHDVNHINVINMRDVFFDVEYPKNNGTFERSVVVVLDLAQGGEMLDFMMATGKFPETLARTYFVQLLSGVSACHHAGVYHRDIKPENLLFDDSFQLKIADFGLSALQPPGKEPYELRTKCGSQSYMAPEVVAGGAYLPAPTDLWSCGVVLFILLTGCMPFTIAGQRCTFFRFVKAGHWGAFWERHGVRVSPEAQELIQALLSVNPQSRPTLSQIWDYPWINGKELSPSELQAEMRWRQHHVQKKEKQAAIAAQQAKEEARQEARRMQRTARPPARPAAAAVTTVHPPPSAMVVDPPPSSSFRFGPGRSGRFLRRLLSRSGGSSSSSSSAEDTPSGAKSGPEAGGEADPAAAEPAPAPAPGPGRGRWFLRRILCHRGSRSSSSSSSAGDIPSRAK